MAQRRSEQRSGVDVSKRHARGDTTRGVLSIRAKSDMDGTLRVGGPNIIKHSDCTGFSVATDCFAQVGPYSCGSGQRLLIIAGPCVLESRDLALRIAESLRDAVEQLPVNLVFKASFDKANRTSINAYRGPGLDAGLRILSDVASLTGLPVTTDIHLPAQAVAVAEVCDLLQIPAFLARQTDLLVAAAETRKAVNVKKGQFLAPGDMQHVISKLRFAGCEHVLACERGTFFGYGRLVNDMRALPIMRELGAPVIFDATHSVQEPGGLGGATGGNRQMVEPLARGAVAVGIDGLFFETHPDPDSSPSDGANMIPLDGFPALLSRVTALRETVERLDHES